MGYKIGDLVKIKNDLQVGEKYGECSVIDDMLIFRGTLDVIENIDIDGDYYLANDNNPYAWNEDMLEPSESIEENTVMDIEKLNMQMMMKDIFNSCQVGEVFEDRDELKEFRNQLYKFINLLDKYENDNFDIGNEIECEHLEYQKNMNKERCENCKLSWEFYYCGNTELRCSNGFDIPTVNVDRIVNKASCGYYKPKQIKF